LPQAKLFAGACALGPAVLAAEGAPSVFEIRLRILDAGGRERFAGETSTARMKRSFDELAGWLRRDNPVPPGTVLLTGTGLVPPDDFTLEPGQRVEIHVPGIGTLVNPVAREWRPSASGRTYEKRGPWRPSEPIGEFPASDAADVDAAVDAAAAAFRDWSRRPAAARGDVLRRAADAVERRVEQIAQDMTLEMGKPLRESRLEAARMAHI